MLKLTLVLLLVTVIASPGFLQEMDGDYPAWDSDSKLGKPFFVLNTYQRLSENGQRTRVDVAIEVIHDVLQFVREDSHFVANVEVSISLAKKIKKHKTELISREIKYLKKQVSVFEETNSRKDRLTGIFPLFAEPGEYKLTVVLTDQESRRKTTLEKELNLKSFNPNALQLSDIITSLSPGVDQITRLSETPFVSGESVDSTLPVVVLFDLWRPEPSTVAEVRLEVRARNGQVVKSDSLSVFGGEKLGTYWFQIDPTCLSFGKYDAILQAQSGNLKVEKKSDFSLNFFGLPTSISNINDAISQLSIIADKKDLARLRETPHNHKEAALTEFWDLNFPCPNEEVNGKMMEFYDRVSYANAQFGDGSEGWQTDRGRVFIIYGKPSDIERQIQPDQDAPYEIWYYNHLSKRFVFRDEHGFGEYRLVTPLW